MEDGKKRNDQISKGGRNKNLKDSFITLKFSLTFKLQNMKYSYYEVHMRQILKGIFLYFKNTKIFQKNYRFKQKLQLSREYFQAKSIVTSKIKKKRSR